MKDTLKHYELTIQAQKQQIDGLLEKVATYKRIIKQQNNCVDVLFEAYEEERRTDAACLRLLWDMLFMGEGDVL